jgi:hypothetical protein
MFENTKLIKRDSSCVGGDCAAVLAVNDTPVAFERAGEPGYLVQGQVDLTGDEREAARMAFEAKGIGQADTEGIVWVPANVLDERDD